MSNDVEPLVELLALRSRLQSYFVEREEVIDGLLAGLLSGEHVLVLGPVGTAKSMLVQTLCGQIAGATFFSWLLTKFSTPEELFGPISLQGLERDELRRITDNKLPSAHVAFLDEIFKSSSAILNSLLAILNERVYHNGTSPEPVPLLTLVAASNELPEEGELMALYDRFLLRFHLGYVSGDEGFLQLLKLEREVPMGSGITMEDLRELQKRVREVTFPDCLLQDLVALRHRLEDLSIAVSDRRYKKVLDVLRAYALLDGRDCVEVRDLTKLEHILWSDPNERPEIVRAVSEVIRRFELQSKELVTQAHQQHEYATRYWPDNDQRLAASVESLAKLRRLHSRTESLLESSRGRDDGVRSELRKGLDEIAALMDDLLLHVSDVSAGRH